MKYLVTHSGSFHADEVCSSVVLTALFENADLVRTRDAQTIETLGEEGVVYDVGGRHDPERMRFDHHMRGARKREDGSTYSSFGLIWDKFGRDFLRISDVPEDHVEDAWQRFDQEFVLPIDMIDTGDLSSAKIGIAGGITMSAIISTLNPDFDEMSPKTQDAQFKRAVAFAGVVIKSFVRTISADLRADAGIRKAIENSGNNPILTLPYSLDAQPAIDRAEARHILAIVTPSSSGGWGVTVARTSANTYENVMDLPGEWAGLSGQDVADVSGVPDATFCHSARFYAAAKTKEGAMRLAEIAVEKHLEISDDIEP